MGIGWEDQVGGQMEGESTRRYHWNAGVFGVWCGNPVQWKLPVSHDGNPRENS